ncbi:unnamed protein product, partial [Prorocentrum cordatum]
VTDKHSKSFGRGKQQMTTGGRKMSRDEYDELSGAMDRMQMAGCTTWAWRCATTTTVMARAMALPVAATEQGGAAALVAAA